MELVTGRQAEPSESLDIVVGATKGQHYEWRGPSYRSKDHEFFPARGTWSSRNRSPWHFCDAGEKTTHV
ncbi:unnamed protein product [Prunus armeniaca]|uniref:Uncharacterized protein n=1 Tax=Prunus armeniaca TaxID=36596 RepID=A0A6J5VCX7_PRUAR|nr:unnamed protein product [Prunus armeniaca]